MHFCIVIWPQAFGDQGVKSSGLKENGTFRRCDLVEVGLALCRKNATVGEVFEDSFTQASLSVILSSLPTA